MCVCGGGVVPDWSWSLQYHPYTHTHTHTHQQTYTNLPPPSLYKPLHTLRISRSPRPATQTQTLSPSSKQKMTRMLSVGMGGTGVHYSMLPCRDSHRRWNKIEGTDGEGWTRQGEREGTERGGKRGGAAGPRVSSLTHRCLVPASSRVDLPVMFHDADRL